jgi:hypothetical protein
MSTLLARRLARVGCWRGGRKSSDDRLDMTRIIEAFQKIASATSVHFRNWLLPTQSRDLVGARFLSSTVEKVRAMIRCGSRLLRERLAVTGGETGPHF